MTVRTDIEIAQAAEIRPIREIAEKLGIDEKYLDLYGAYKAKIDNRLLKDQKDKPDES